MGIPTFWDRLRSWIGNAGWGIFLWSIRKTSDQYFKMFEDEMRGVEWEYEDQLPDTMPIELYNAMFHFSEVNGVRYFPYILHRNKRAFLVHLVDDPHDPDPNHDRD